MAYHVFVWIAVLGIFLKVIQGQSNVDVTFTVDTITTTVATLNWDASNSIFTGIFYNISIEPSGPTFVTGSGEGSVFSSAGSTGISGLSPGTEYIITVTFTDGSDTKDITVGAFNAVPLPPMINTPNPITTSSATVSWTSADGSAQDTFVLALTGDETDLGEVAFVEMTDVSRELEGLASGYEYTLTVKAKSGSQESVGASATFTTVPTAATAINFTDVRTDLMNVSWTIDPATNWDAVTLQLKELSVGNVEDVDVIYAKEEGSTFQFTSLLPGHEYRVTVVVVVNVNVESDTYSDSQYTKPLQIGEITAQAQNVNQLKLRAQKPTDSVISELIVAVVPQPGTDILAPSLNSDHYEITISSLTPGTNHYITVTTKSGDKTGTPKTVTFSTKPEPPTALYRKTTTTTSMIVGWGPPTSGNHDSFALVSDAVTDSTIARFVFEYHIPNLIAGREYSVSMYTHVNGLQSDATSASFRTKPNSPQNIQFSSVTASSFTVTWDAPPGEVTGYSIEGNDKGSDERTHTFTDRQAGAEFTITVISKAGELSSDRATSSVVTLPNVVRDIQIDSITTSTVTFSWTAPIETNIVTGYRYIIVAIDNSLWRNITTSDLEGTESGLYAGQTYDINVWVYTHLDGHTSKQSSLPAVAIVTLVPKPPTALTVAEKTTTTLRVVWTSPTDTIFDRFKYTVYKSGDTVTSVVTGDTELFKEGLDPGYIYFIDIWTEVDDSQGNVVESAVQQIVLVMVPEPPVNLQETSTSRTTITIAWNAPGTGTFTEYQLNVTYGTDNVIESLSKGVQSYHLTDLSASRTYRISLATLSGSEISASIQVLITTDSPSRPDLDISIASSTSIECAWAAGEAEVASHSILQLLGVDDQVIEIENFGQGTLTHTFSELTPGQFYTVTVTLTVDAADTSLTRSFVLTPLEVSNFVISTVSETVVDCSWDIDSASYQTEFVIAYHQIVHTVKDGSSTSQRIENLFAGSWCNFTISAKSTHFGYSIASRYVWGIGTTRPRGVQIFRAEAENHNTVTLTWEADTRSNQTSYSIWFESLTGGTPTPFTSSIIVSFPITSHAWTDFYPGAKYKFRIKTISGEVESAWDDTATVRLLPLSPSNLEISVTTEDMTVSWNKPPSEITHYRFGYAVTGSIDWTDITIDGADTSETITGLVSGQNYTVRIFGGSDGKESADPSTKDITLIPVMTASLTEDVERTSTNEVVILYTEDTGNGVFDENIFSINSDRGYTTVIKIKSDTDRVVRFSDLIPGFLYTITARTRSGDRRSTIENIQVLTVPGKPSVTCSAVQSSELTITMAPPMGGISEYIIECSGLNCEALRTIRTSGSDLTSATYQSLVPFNSYRFHVSAFRKIGEHEKTGRSVMITCSTVETAPGEVASFDYKVDGYTITLTWTPPLVTGGLIRKYTLEYIGTKDNEPTKEESYTLGAKQFSHKITNLVAGYRYQFTIRAVTVAVGQPKTIEHFFPILEPSIATQYESYPDAMKAISTGKPTETGFSVRIVNPFTDKNGVVTSYSVIVAMSSAELGDDSTVKTWSESQKMSFTLPYIAIYKCTDLFYTDSVCPYKATPARRKRSAGESVDITIGANGQCATDSDEYCNGGLNAGTNYHVALRAYTENGLHADTPFSDPITTEGSNTPENSNPTIIILGSVLSVVVGFALVGLIVFFVYRSRRRAARQKKKADSTEMNSKNETVDYEIVPDNTTAYDSEMRKVTDNQQYEEIPIKHIGDATTKEDKSQYMALDKPIYYANIVEESSEYYNTPKGSSTEPAQYQTLQYQN